MSIKRGEHGWVTSSRRGSLATTWGNSNLPYRVHSAPRWNGAQPPVQYFWAKGSSHPTPQGPSIRLPIQIWQLQTEFDNFFVETPTSPEQLCSHYIGGSSSMRMCTYQVSHFILKKWVLPHFHQHFPKPLSKENVGVFFAERVGKCK
jgi:hypothetical protein